MYINNKKLVAILIISIFVFSINKAFAAKSENRDKNLYRFNDYTQIINPLISAGLSGQENSKGLGHFMLIYSQSAAITHTGKFIGSTNKWKIGKRPSEENKQAKYDGMPSGHINAAWFAASYVRTFTQEYKYIAIPLYITAAASGFSLVKSKQNTVLQVVSSAAIAEIVNIVNKKLAWSNQYRSISLNLSRSGGSLGIKIKL